MPLIPVETVTLAEHAGQDAVAGLTAFKGVILNSTAGVGKLTLYKGDNASGTVIAILTTTAEKPTEIYMLPADYVEHCPLGIFYALVDSTGVSTAYLKHIPRPTPTQ